MTLSEIAARQEERKKVFTLARDVWFGLDYGRAEAAPDIDFLLAEVEARVGLIAALEAEVTRMRADLLHLREDAGPESCAALAAENARLREQISEMKGALAK